jgi:hypothetical protein
VYREFSPPATTKEDISSRSAGSANRFRILKCSNGQAAIQWVRGIGMVLQKPLEHFLFSGQRKRVRTLF